MALGEAEAASDPCNSIISPRVGRGLRSLQNLAGAVQGRRRPSLRRASARPPIAPEHSAVSWLRSRLAKTLPVKPWEETPAAYGARLRRCCAAVNAELDVEGLRRAFPKRVQDLVDSEGDRLKQ